MLWVGQYPEFQKEGRKMYDQIGLLYVATTCTNISDTVVGLFDNGKFTTLISAPFRPIQISHIAKLTQSCPWMGTVNEGFFQRVSDMLPLVGL